MTPEMRQVCLTVLGSIGFEGLSDEALVAVWHHTLAPSLAASNPVDQRVVVADLTATAVLIEFVDDVECCGGLEYNLEERTYGPTAALEWTAIAVTYLKACSVLGREPKYYDGDPEDDEEDEEEE